MVLTFEEAIKQVKISEGQLLIPLQALRLDDDNLEQLFIYTAKQLQNKRPVRDILNVNVNQNGVHIPNALSVLALKYPLYPNLDRNTSPIARNLWWFDPHSRILKCIFSSTFNVVYLREFTIGNFQISDTPTYTIEGESAIDFFLRCNYKQGSLEISKTDIHNVKHTALEVSRSGNIVTLGGTLGSGTIDLSTLKVNMTLTDTSAGNITVTMYNKRKAIRDFDISNRPFMLAFTVAVLRSFGSLKYQATLDPSAGLPFSLQADTMLDRARVLEDQLQTMLNNNDKWYEFGY